MRSRQDISALPPKHDRRAQPLCNETHQVTGSRSGNPGSGDDQRTAGGSQLRRGGGYGAWLGHRHRRRHGTRQRRDDCLRQNVQRDLQVRRSRPIAQGAKCVRDSVGSVFSWVSGAAPVVLPAGQSADADLIASVLRSSETLRHG